MREKLDYCGARCPRPCCCLLAVGNWPGLRNCPIMNGITLSYLTCLVMLDENVDTLSYNSLGRAGLSRRHCTIIIIIARF